MTSALFSVRGYYAAVFPLIAAATFIAVATLWDPARAALRRAVERYGSWARRTIAALHLSLEPHDLLLRHVAVALGGAAVGHTLGGTSGAVVGLVLGAAAPYAWAARAIQQRRKQLESQLDSALQTLANSLLATQNLVESFAALARHLPPPICQEADLIVKDVKVGARIEEALHDFGQRCQSQYVDAVVTALTIGLRTGGDLARVLKTIAGVVRETMRVEGVMAAKTSEGKTSAWVLGAMPVVFTLLAQKMNPEWLDPLWHDPLGNVLVALAALLTLAGVALVLRISKLDA